MTLVLVLAPLTLCAQKFAHYSNVDIIQAMPAYRTAMTELQNIGKQYETELTAMQAEIKTKIEKYQKEVNDQTPANMRERREAEIKQLQERFQTAYEDNERAYSEKQQQLFEPIYKKVEDAVAQVAKENGYVYVLDQSLMQGSQKLITINESLSENVTAKIQSKLGITAADIQAGKAFIAKLQQEAQAAQAAQK